MNEFCLSLESFNLSSYMVKNPNISRILIALMFISDYRLFIPLVLVMEVYFMVLFRTNCGFMASIMLLMIFCYTIAFVDGFFGNYFFNQVNLLIDEEIGISNPLKSQLIENTVLKSVRLLSVLFCQFGNIGLLFSITGLTMVSFFVIKMGFSSTFFLIFHVCVWIPRIIKKLEIAFNIQ